MGSYCTLYFGERSIMDNKNSPLFTSFFYPEDKQVLHTPNEIEPKYVYKAPVYAVVERLRSTGASISIAKKYHEKYLLELRDNYMNLLNRDEWNSWNKDDVIKSLEIVNKGGFEKWKDLIRQYLVGREPITPTDPFIPNYYVRDEMDLIGMEEIVENSWFGLTNLDDHGFLAILEQIEDKLNTHVTLEYTDLINGGWIKESDELASESPASTILLTEGISDCRFLKTAISLLCPHLSRSFTFLNFEEFKLQASASTLVHTVKALNAAGISNNVVAVFDNDTAAKDAQKNLLSLKLKKNFRVINLPEIQSLRNYPTVGPQGSLNMDVNGFAGSIELYFPTEALKDSSGALFPVIWKGYVEGQKKYQGEIANKHQIQKNFNSIIESIQAGNSSVKDYDFENLKKVLEEIMGFKFLKN